MSGRSAGRAVEAFIAPFQRAVACVTREILVRGPGRSEPVRSLQFRGNAVRLRGRHRLELSVLVEYVAEEGRPPARYATPLVGYRYELAHADGPMILAYHWHPVGVSPVTWPHLHLAGQVASVPFDKAHLPTGLVSRQDVLRFAIADLGVEPIRDDWQAILTSR